MTKNKRFVVLSHHSCPLKQDHLDIIVEGFGLLGEEESPLMKFETKDESKSIKTADYTGNVRILYLTYEGPMSGNRGQVRRIDTGDWYISEQGEIVLNGTDVNGKFILTLNRVE